MHIADGREITEPIDASHISDLLFSLLELADGTERAIFCLASVQAAREFFFDSAFKVKPSPSLSSCSTVLRRKRERRRGETRSASAAKSYLTLPSSE